MKAKKTSCHINGKLRIVLLSDLHNESYGSDNEILLTEIDRQKPDLVAVAGDLLTAGVDGREQVS